MQFTFAALLALLALFGGLRLRARVAALRATGRAIDASRGEPARFRAVHAADVNLSESTLVEAAAAAREQGLDVVDLVPGDLSALDLIALCELVDPVAYRRQRLARAISAGHATLVADSVAERARPELTAAADAAPGPFASAAAAIRHVAPGRAALALAPGLRAPRRGLRTQRAVLAAQIPAGFDRLVLSVRLIFHAGLVALAVAAPWPFLLPLAAIHLQPLIALAGQGGRAVELGLLTLARSPIEIVRAILMLAVGAPPRADDDATRATYAAIYAGGSERLFEPARDTCPLCGARAVTRFLRFRDHIQYKPGRFRLDRCRSCGHIFQNPRLSLEGLDVVYRDFYDGLGEGLIDMVFSATPALYRARAELVAAHARPTAWLDVGTGHAHFPLVAREVLPSTRFDGLDLGDGVELAARRGWLDDAHRGLFPELAASLAERGYDCVSMHHYLEHTRDPAAELAAAATVLRPGGTLHIEVPDPTSFLGRVLRSFWIAWFQPQHQHLLSPPNLERLLRAHGFEPLAWVRGPAHISGDFMFATSYHVNALAGGPWDVPWRPRRGPLGRLRHWAAWAVGMPWVTLGALADLLFGPLARRGHGSNAYRVVARRVATPTDGAT